MEQEINVMIFYVSAAVFAGLVSVLAYVLFLQKKRDGISYSAAIHNINNFAQRKYGGSHAMEQFCDDYHIDEKQAFLDAINAEGREVLIPQIIETVLNKIGYKVQLVNKVYYMA
jgi:hypothetical protein